VDDIKDRFGSKLVTKAVNTGANKDKPTGSQPKKTHPD
jgi:hypothetical protein